MSNEPAGAAVIVRTMLEEAARNVAGSSEIRWHVDAIRSMPYEVSVLLIFNDPSAADLDLAVIDVNKRRETAVWCWDVVDRESHAFGPPAFEAPVSDDVEALRRLATFLTMATTPLKTYLGLRAR